MSETLQWILDRREIDDLLARYASALDERDWERLASCFAADAEANYGGATGRCVGYPAIEQLCRSILEPLDASQHLIAGPEVEIVGDEAHARTGFQAQHVRRGCEGGSHFIIGGTYVDRLVRRPEGWRIASRELRAIWSEGNPRVLAG